MENCYLVSFLLVNAIFWSFFPHSAHCKLVFDFNKFLRTNIKCPDHSIHLMIGIICIYHRHNESAVTKANQVLSVTERFFQFHEKFALPYFYEKKQNIDNRNRVGARTTY